MVIITGWFKIERETEKTYLFRMSDLFIFIDTQYYEKILRDNMVINVDGDDENIIIERWVPKSAIFELMLPNFIIAHFNS